MQWQFWIVRERINEKTGEIFTEQEAKDHVQSFRKTSIHYWRKFSDSEDEAREKLEEHKQYSRQLLIDARSKNTPDKKTTSLQYWINKGFSKEDAKKQLSERQSTFTLDKCKAKYGEEQGIIIYDNRQKKWQKSLKKHGNAFYHKKSVSYKAFLKRGKTLDDYIEYRIKLGSNEYILNKSIKYIIDNNLDFDELQKVYKHFLYIHHQNNGTASRESLKFLIPIYRYCRKILKLSKNDIMLGITGSKEVYVRNSAGKGGYFLDFCILSSKIIIEYNGHIFHPDPWFMSDDQFKNYTLPFGNTTGEQKYKYDQKKLKYLKSQGYMVYVVWSNKDFDLQLEEVKKFINDNHVKTNS